MVRRNKGKVYLVGAGPGDPGLLTLRGKECLEQADVVLYDYLANPSLLAHAQDRAERIYVGRRGKGKYPEQETLNRLLIDRANAGDVVVRLKGGDPFVFGRGGEEAEALALAGIEFEVVPGVTAAVAAPAYAGIPHRRGFHRQRVSVRRKLCRGGIRLQNRHVLEVSSRNACHGRILARRDGDISSQGA